MRVLLGTMEVAGYYRGLKAGFEELGVPCTFVNLGAHAFGYGGDDAGALVRAIRSARTKGWLGMRASQALRFPLLWKMARTHDAFIFGFGNSLLPRNADLEYLKRRGKKILFQFHGSDSRPPYLDGAAATLPGFSLHACVRASQDRKRQLVHIGRYADAIVDIPPQAHFHERAYTLWLRVGICNRPARWPAEITFRSNDPVRILHSPSNPAAKGTVEIERAVERLRGKGLRLELVKIHGRPNAEVLDELERCDFVVDQVWSDYAMPGLAVEAAWFGKPVVICGYAGPMWDALLEPDDRPPTLYRDPSELEASIERLATDATFRRDLGARARAFVETKWSPREVARRYLQILEGTAPKEWLIEPALNRYWQGVCQPAEVTRKRIADCIEMAGVASLQVGDKPDLQRVFEEAARGATPA